MQVLNYTGDVEKKFTIKSEQASSPNRYLWCLPNQVFWIGIGYDIKEKHALELAKTYQSLFTIDKNKNVGAEEIFYFQFDKMLKNSGIELQKARKIIIDYFDESESGPKKRGRKSKKDV